jgi:DNA-binding transcriptional LysR family regulator
MRWTDRIGNRVKLRDLHIVLAVAKAGSTRKAAADLAVSQPVVSKALSDLEHTLGVRLFDRSPEGVEPTRYGRALLKCGIAVFDDLRQGVETLASLSDPTAGELRLGSTEPLAAGFVGAVVEQLSQQYPRIAFRVVTADPLSLKEQELQQRKIELAITPTEGLIPAPDIDAEILFDDRQVVVTGANSKLARRKSVDLSALLQEPWILPPPETIIGSTIADAFRAAGIEPPRAQIESFSIPLCLRLVATGRFVTMLPISMVTLGRHPPLKLLRVDCLPVPRRTAVITLKGRTRSPLAELFTDCSRKMARPLARLRM